MKITPSDKRKRIFDGIMAYYGLDESEIELCGVAYRRDPEAGRSLYAALRAEIALAGTEILIEDARQWVKLSSPPFVLEKKSSKI